MVARYQFKILFFAISVLLHLGLIGLLNQTRIKAPVVKIKKQPIIIKARLVFSQPVAVVKQAVVDVKPKPKLKEQPSQITKTVAKSVKNLKQADNKPLISTKNPRSSSKAKKTTVSKARKTTLSKTTTSSLAPTSIDQLYNATRNIIKRHHLSELQTMQQQANINPYGSKQSLSDLVPKPIAHQYQKVEIDIEQRRKVKIYCDSNAKQGLAIMSNLFGGRVVCEKLPDLKQFMPKPKPKFKPYQ